ncbi:hypothetical protein DCAR_0521757 [Daucus carota subsp. sativus]|uniref:Uncharacterized protein n=1 Tax=Daucus carota subsp. sativus TaxID=79200 RepID=A0A161YP96_DAUCS|nr:PREDICTED: uncharacterized protein LOC108219857 isoform X2 [Daucus carota subsp. sativus]WOH02368.1 hypothetical protein DCAR_0521757 [Daucus carota subsp. sativus]
MSRQSCQIKSTSEQLLNSGSIRGGAIITGELWNYLNGSVSCYSSLEICRKDDSDITCKDLKAFDRNFSNQRLDYTQNPNENPLDEHIIYFFLTLKQ